MFGLFRRLFSNDEIDPEWEKQRQDDLLDFDDPCHDDDDDYCDICGYDDDDDDD